MAPLQWHKGVWSDKKAGPEREACPVMKAWPERQVLPVKKVWSESEAWPIKQIVFPVHLHKEAGLRPFISQDRWPLPLFQVIDQSVLSVCLSV